MYSREIGNTLRFLGGDTQRAQEIRHDFRRAFEDLRTSTSGRGRGRASFSDVVEISQQAWAAAVAAARNSGTTPAGGTPANTAPAPSAPETPANNGTPAAGNEPASGNSGNAGNNGNAGNSGNVGNSGNAGNNGNAGNAPGQQGKADTAPATPAPSNGNANPAAPHIPLPGRVNVDLPDETVKKAAVSALRGSAGVLKRAEADTSAIITVPGKALGLAKAKGESNGNGAAAPGTAEGRTHGQERAAEVRAGKSENAEDAGKGEFVASAAKAGGGTTRSAILRQMILARASTEPGTPEGTNAEAKAAPKIDTVTRDSTETMLKQAEVEVEHEQVRALRSYQEVVKLVEKQLTTLNEANHPESASAPEARRPVPGVDISA